MIDFAQVMLTESDRGALRVRLQIGEVMHDLVAGWLAVTAGSLRLSQHVTQHRRVPAQTLAKGGYRVRESALCRRSGN